MDERCKASFDAATESVKQILALATASIGATIVLFDDDKVTGIDLGPGFGVYLGLALLALSVVFGLISLNMLAGQLGAKEITAPSIYAPPLKYSVMIQALSFGGAILSLVFAVIFGG